MYPEIPKTIDMISDDETRWQAVLARDRRADGQFVVAVVSTGIFCRPTCPARHPLRVNVQFYESAQEAQSAGFRACRRCRPEESLDPRMALVQEACRYIEAHLDENLTLETIGAALHSSPDYLARLFKRFTGVTPRAYAQAHRLGQVKDELRAGSSVAGSVYGAGYGSSRALYEQKPLGMTPGEYRKGAVGMNVYYSIVPCSMGLILVAATEKGICFVGLGDQADALETELMHEFPSAALKRDETRLGTDVEVLLRYLDGQQPDLQLPLDVQATAFQQRVWQELRLIPYGETRTYQQIAESLGQPNASRAVGRACATNPTSLVVPCHRVLRTDGDLSGYRWGLNRKQALLDLEAAHHTNQR